MPRLSLATALALFLAGAAAAQDLAVIVENRDYRRLPDIGGDTTATDLEPALEEAGFEVLRLTDGTAEQLQERFANRRRDLEDAGRLVIVLQGHMVSDSATAWLMGVDALRPDGFTVGRAGLPLAALNPILAEKPGAALLILMPGGERGRVGAGLQPGYLPVAEVPQGVTVLSGEAEAMVDIVAEDILRDGVPLGTAVEERRGEVVAYGYLPRTSSFLPLTNEAVEGSSESPDRGSTRATADDAAWLLAERRGTEDAIADYLDRFPRGRHVDQAEALLRDLRRSPEAVAAEAERDLNLSRDARREIQRNLSVLGYETRGIDGIFGPGTRSAIRQFQDSQGIEVTGYLSGNQIARLQEAAADRQAQLEAEARRRQEEADRADSAFWRETGSGENEDGMRRYLARYPDGLFSSVAEGRLTDLEREREREARGAERDAWGAARQADTEASYEDYLESYPQGQFVDAAEARLTALREDRGREGEIAAAKASESEVLGNPITRLLVERRLQQLGLDPGAADGEFDDRTRRAIRRFQRARDLPVTGFVNQQTLVRMLAG